MEKKFDFFKKTENVEDLRSIANKPNAGKDSNEIKIKIGNDSEVNSIEQASLKKLFGFEGTIDEEIQMWEAEIAVIDAKLQVGGDHLDGVSLKKLKVEKVDIEKHQKEIADYITKHPEDEEVINLVYQLKVFKNKREKLEMLLDSDIPMITPGDQDNLIEKRKECLDAIDTLKRTRDHIDSKLN